MRHFINPWSPWHVAAFNGSYKNSPRQKDSCGADRLFGFNVGQELSATHTHTHTSMPWVCWYFLLMAQQLLCWNLNSHCSHSLPEPLSCLFFVEKKRKKTWRRVTFPLGNPLFYKNHFHPIPRDRNVLVHSLIWEVGDYRDFDETVQAVDKSVRLIASVILYCFILFYLFIEMNLNLLPIRLEVSKKTFCVLFRSSALSLHRYHVHRLCAKLKPSSAPKIFFPSDIFVISVLFSLI